jgi:3-hydroxyacyl-CoA dehydrogenase/3a,7a,12a-trihydroxy-5b-cholest-24-enoyl-CoA hydratase
MMSDADFLAMSSGKADPQKLFMEGKLKITGNVMASQKLSFLKDVKPAQAPAATPAVVTKESRAPAFFEQLAKRLKPGIGSARIHFKLSEPSSEWVVDLSKGTVERGGGQANTVLSMAEETLLALASGASPKALFQQGKMRVDGDIMIAHRLDFLS